MGHVQHHAIVVTSLTFDYAQTARNEAIQLGLTCTEIVQSEVNYYQTFLVVPDGSKSDWPTDHDGDTARARFIDGLRSMRYGDGSSPYEWVEIAYGRDDKSADVTRHEWSPAEPAQDWRNRGGEFLLVAEETKPPR